MKVYLYFGDDDKKRVKNWFTGRKRYEQQLKNDIKVKRNVGPEKKVGYT